MMINVLYSIVYIYIVYMCDIVINRQQANAFFFKKTHKYSCSLDLGLTVLICKCSKENDIIYWQLRARRYIIGYCEFYIMHVSAGF